MNITTAQVKEIRLELAKLRPAKITLDGNRRQKIPCKNPASRILRLITPV